MIFAADALRVPLAALPEFAQLHELAQHPSRPCVVAAIRVGNVTQGVVAVLVRHPLIDKEVRIETGRAQHLLALEGSIRNQDGLALVVHNRHGRSRVLELVHVGRCGTRGSSCLGGCPRARAVRR